MLLALILLTGCVIEAPAPPARTLPISLPKPVWPDVCVADWYAHATLPPCVEAWIGDITTQQKQIEKKHKRKLNMNDKPAH
jgi:hypothetical protein